MSVFDKSLLIKIAVSMLCGFIVGVERHLHKKPIDIRTSSLICLGTMAFIFLGTEVGGDKDSTRVLGQVVTGIGFLGAGAIITRQGLVIGMTSASVVWVLAAIGAAVGFGRYSMGIALSLVAVFILTVLQYFEDWTENILRPRGTPKVHSKDERGVR